MKRRSLLVPGMICAAMALSGCGNIDDKKLEGKLKEGIESQTGEKVRAVACPEGRELKKGDVFTCTVTTTGGKTGTIKVTQSDDEGNVRWVLQG
jgi:hypothetical protein